MSTKTCPACGCTDLVLLRSINQKICAACKTEFDWFLDPGQKQLQGPSRADRKSPIETHEFDEARIDRIAASHGDGEHYAALG